MRMEHQSSEALGFSIVQFTLSEVKKAVIHNPKSRDCGCKPLGRYPYERAAADLNLSVKGLPIQ